LICDKGLLNKVVKNLPITDDEDIAIRSAAQQANDWIAKQLNITNSVLHYFFWNTFRSCCLRQNPHCSNCAENCSLPIQYKNLRIYSKKCIFESVCSSREAEIKVIDPPYLGHYY
jgi:hypothetical protein